MKKIAIMVMALVLALNVVSVSAEQTDELKSGDYIQLGSYMGEPIIWRCVDTEGENGTLLVSDKILCYKCFDARTAPSEYDNSNFWQDSTLRAWLNSTASAGNVIWPRNNPPVSEHIMEGSSYANEKGFLSDENFTPKELSAIKTVTQWQVLPADKLNLETNGVTEEYKAGFDHYHGPVDSYTTFRKIEDLETIYGAKYQIADTMFLLDETQLYLVWKNFGSVEAEPTQSAAREYASPHLSYWLRSAVGIRNVTITENNNIYTTMNSQHGHIGVRPACYLNEDTAVILSGSGTKEDPYVITGREEQEEITVFSNGKQLAFDQQPIIENDRVFVPMRAIFENFGAEVTWDGESKTINAISGETTVTMQIDNDVMIVDNQEIQLDVSPFIVGDRTLVPIRAIAEGLGSKVEWIDQLERVVITK